MAYATVEKLASVLKVSATTREADLQRVLNTAAGEIKSEIGWEPAEDTDPDDVPTPFTLEELLSLLESVNLDRAQDIWETEQVPAGILGLGSETPLIVPRNSWERCAQRLVPAKKSWGIA